LTIISCEDLPQPSRFETFLPEIIQATARDVAIRLLMSKWSNNPLRDDIDLEYFQSLLERRRDEILARQDGQQDAAGTVELDQARVGRLSRMGALQQQAMARATNQRSAVELQRIEAALVRIRTGDYGYCLRCGEDIAEKRLKADPSALSCITCAGLAERK